jgi:HAD superfamily hydrolase (TIGR01549 family)
MKVLCFDLDGTIIDTWDGEIKAKFTMREELAKHSEIPEDMIARTYDILWAHTKQDYMNMLADGLGEMDIRTIHLGLVLDEIWGEDEPERLAQLHWDTILDNMHIYPDAAQVIETLSEKYTLTMITNGAGDLQREKIKRLSFKDHFKDIIVSGDLGHHKPSKAIFDEITKRTNTEPSETAYIGNSYRKDILGAQAAGWQTVWLNRENEETEGPQPDWTIKELRELLELF